MKKGGLVAGLVALVIIGGVLVWLIASKASTSNNTPKNSSNNTPAATNNDQVQSGTAAVTMQGETFSPQTIKVKKGTKVTWTNNDSIGHDVVADDAKNAAGLPSENSLFGKGGTYTFTFNTTGTFSYHCAAHPFMTGAVEVVD